MSDFLAKIRLSIEGQEGVVSKLSETSQKMDEISGKQISLPWMEKFYPTLNQGEVATKGFAESFKRLGNETRMSSKSMGDFERALRRVIVVAPTWMVFRAIMQGTMKTIGDHITFLKDLETAMARIKIVGKGTEEQYDNLKNSLIALSMIYGTVASDALSAAVIFAQQGKSVEEVIKLTRVAMIASQVLGADIKTTVENLTAAINGFNIPAEDAINIVDKLINVEKQFAVTSANLADAIKVSSATANQMGISINSFLGDVTAVIEVTRKSGSEAGRSLQFIYARLLTTGKDVLGQIAKVPVYLDNQNKATFELTNTYRSATDVLDDLAIKWDSLTNKEKLSIAQNVASKRQLTVFMALMQNYDASLNARIASLSATGKAEIAFGIIQDTAAFKLNKLSASWNNLTVSIGDTTVWKGALDVTSDLINNIALLINKYQALKNAVTKEKDNIDKTTESQVSQVQSISELIKMRNIYLSRVPTDKNKEMLNKIEEALQGVLKSSKIKINIDDRETINNLDKIISEKREFAIKAKIEWEITSEKVILQDKIKRLQESLKPSGFIIKDIIDSIKMGKSREELKKLENDLSNLDKKRNSLIDERMSKYNAEKVNLEAKKNIIEDDSEVSEELLDSEIEKLNIQSQINKAKSNGIFNSEQLVDLEIKLVKNSLFSYDQHQKSLKLAELQNQKEEEHIKLLLHQLGLRGDMLKLVGEQEFSIIRQEMAYKTLIFGENYVKNSMEDRLKLAQALIAEADKQEGYARRYVDLYKIAKKYGMGTAQEIAGFMGGKEFTTLSQESQNVLRRTNKGLYEQGLSEQYFKNIGFKFPEDIEIENKAKRNRDIIKKVFEENPINFNLDTNNIITQMQDAFSKNQFTIPIAPIDVSKITVPSGKTKESLDTVKDMLANIKPWLSGLYTPEQLTYITPPVPKGQEILTNNTVIIEKVEGAITDENISELLSQAEKKLKSLPNYIGDTELNQLIDKIDAEMNNPKSKMSGTLDKKIGNF